MRLNIIILFFNLLSAQLYAQKEDYTWLMGYMLGPDNTPDTGAAIHTGTTILNFNYSPLKLTRYFHGLDLAHTNSSISDEQGNLLMYTNGTRIFNHQHKLLEGADSLCYGYSLYRKNTYYYQSGITIPQQSILLKQPNSSNIYTHFSTFVDSMNKPWTGPEYEYTSQLRMTTIDMSVNGGLGKVVKREEIILKDTLSESFTACKHSNGDDWWIVIEEINTNCIYALLFTKNGVTKIKNKQCIGIKHKESNHSRKVFTPDGRKFITINGYDGLKVYDFDRCRGILSNYKNIPIPEIPDSSFWGYSVAISSNSRFAYVTMTKYVVQFDLEAIDIAGSKVIVATYDGFKDSFAVGTVFHLMQLGPDGKIYISTGNSADKLHYIEFPDLKGMACNVRQHALQLPTIQFGIPSFPNFRLGKADEPCVSNVKENELNSVKLYPNPARDYLIIQLENNHSQNQVIFFDLLGREVFKMTLQEVNKVDISSLNDGTYTLHVFGDNNELIGKSILIKF